MDKNIKITPTEVLEYNYCPRFIYFMNVLAIPQYEERRYLVQRGREEHAKRLERNKEYLWKKIGAVGRQSDVMIDSETLGLRGLVDEILTLRDGSLAPLDFKFSDSDRVYRSHKIQIYCYALLIEEVFEKPVKKGYIFYIRGGSKQIEIPVTEAARRQTRADIKAVLEIIEREKMPGPTSVRSRCADCTYKNICVR